MPLRKISKTIAKSLLGEPATLMYPARARTYYAATRGGIAIDIEKCIFCGLCRKKCPTAALLVSRENRSWEIDRLKCITCNACVEACPKKCLFMRNTYSPAQHIKKSDEFRAAPKPAAPPAAPSGS